MSSKAEKLDKEASKCAASRGFETCYQCGYRSRSCNFHMALKRAVIDKLKRERNMIRRVHKKCDEPKMLYELMERMEGDKRLQKLYDIYGSHFGEADGFNWSYCPHCNAKNLQTTVTELIECIGHDIAGHCDDVMWWARSGPERRKGATRGA